MSADRRICKVTVLFDREDFEALDNYCTQFAFKKSTLIARLVREHLSRENHEPVKDKARTSQPKRRQRQSP
jgi:hypothetical protein